MNKRSGQIHRQKHVWVNRVSFSLRDTFTEARYKHNPTVILECNCKFIEYYTGIEHILCNTHQQALQKCEKCKWISITDDLEFTHLQLR